MAPTNQDPKLHHNAQIIGLKNDNNANDVVVVTPTEKKMSETINPSAGLVIENMRSAEVEVETETETAVTTTTAAKERDSMEVRVEEVYESVKFFQTQVSALSDRDNVSSGNNINIINTTTTTSNNDNNNCGSDNSKNDASSNEEVVPLIKTERKEGDDNTSTRGLEAIAATSNEGSKNTLSAQTSSGTSSVCTSITFGAQAELPPLPIPSLNETLNKFLQNLEALQTEEERIEAQKIVLEFLKGDGPKLQELLVQYDKTKREAGEIGSYVEEFWNDSYLAPDSSVVMNLNPFFVLEGSPDPKLSGDPIRRASMLCFASIKLASQLRSENLKPDTFRGKPLCMDQFKALFAAARVPQKTRDTVHIFEGSSHVAVMCCSQIYYFQALWPNGDVAIDEGDLLDILSSIQDHAHKKDPAEASQTAIGLLTSLGRGEWAMAREEMMKNPKNRESLKLIDSALFVLVLDDYIPKNKHDKASNMLHGSYDLKKKNESFSSSSPSPPPPSSSCSSHIKGGGGGIQAYQAGSCCNRWYDKMQIIVCGDATAGINFEHSAIDGHTALRFVSDIYAETVIKFARSITKIVHSYDTIPHVVQAKVRRALANLDETGRPLLDIFPKKIRLELSQSVKRTIFFAETALGDEIVASDTRVLEFKQYGKKFITSNKLSPDSYVQMSMMLAYFTLYGRIVCTYEPVLTKAFYHGRTEAMRSATMEAKRFCEVFCDPDSSQDAKLIALRNATKVHSQLVKECARGKGVDRHLFALKSIAEKNNIDVPAFFKSKPWKMLNHTVLSTSNCGNPSLALFGFGPVVPDGFGIGYIIKDSSIFYSISSKHRQTSRYAATLESVLQEMAQLMKPIAPKAVSTDRKAAFRNLSKDVKGDIWGEPTPPPSPKRKDKKTVLSVLAVEPAPVMMPGITGALKQQASIATTVEGAEEIPFNFAFNKLDLTRKSLKEA